jgi:hypothetical protein
LGVPKHLKKSSVIEQTRNSAARSTAPQLPETSKRQRVIQAKLREVLEEASPRLSHAFGGEEKRISVGDEIRKALKNCGIPLADDDWKVMSQRVCGLFF